MRHFLAGDADRFLYCCQAFGDVTADFFSQRPALLKRNRRNCVLIGVVADQPPDAIVYADSFINTDASHKASMTTLFAAAGLIKRMPEWNIDHPGGSGISGGWATASRA